MKFHNWVLLKLAPVDHNWGIKLQRGVHTSLCIDVPHPACTQHNCTVNQNEERHSSDREEAVGAVRGGESMCFWLNPCSIYSSSHLHSPLMWAILRYLPGCAARKNFCCEQGHVEYKYNHCRAQKTCSSHHRGLISTGSGVCVLFRQEKEVTGINNCTVVFSFIFHPSVYMHMLGTLMLQMRFALLLFFSSSEDRAVAQCTDINSTVSRNDKHTLRRTKRHRYSYIESGDSFFMRDSGNRKMIHSLKEQCATFRGSFGRNGI